MKSLLTVLMSFVLLGAASVHGQDSDHARPPVAATTPTPSWQSPPGHGRPADAPASATDYRPQQSASTVPTATVVDAVNGTRAIPTSGAFTYQGRLKIGGVPANTPQDIQFTLTDELGVAIGVLPPAVNPLCVDNVVCTDGLFTVELDFGMAYPGDQRELSIAARPAGGVGDCAMGGGYTALNPRQKLTATPYAHALRLPYDGAGTAGGSFVMSLTNSSPMSSSSAIRGIAAGAATFGFSDMAGIRGESSVWPGAGVLGIAEEFAGVVGYTNGAGTPGVFGRSDQATGEGVSGYATGSNGVGVRGEALGANGYAGHFTGRGYFSGSVGIGPVTPSYLLHVEEASPTRTVFANNTAVSGISYGVYGQVASNSGYGVFGTAPYYGLRAEATHTSTYANTRGIIGIATNDGGAGVYGSGGLYGVQGVSATGIGVYGNTSDTTNAVYGYASATTGTNYGVTGRTASDAGRGVYGDATSTTGANYGVYGHTASTSGYAGYFTGPTGSMNYFQQNVGIGDTTPTDGKLVVNGGTASGIKIDHSGSGLANAGLHIEAANAAGIGAWVNGTSTDAMMVIGNDGTGSILRAFGNHDPCCPVFRVEASGWTGINSTAAPGAPLDVERSGGTVAIFNRTTSDGTIIELQQGGTTEGTISVSGTTVSYNAFTGSHFGWTDQRIERGALVSMTGRNRIYHERSEGEPIYGIEPSHKANDPRCLGAYLAILDPASAASSDNPHQVMAVGNGDLWVVDSGRDLQPGDHLISSDVTGHAMLDDEGRFTVGHVIARVAEPVRWDDVTERVAGRRHKRISVFFESFARSSAVGLAKLVEGQQREIQHLNARLESLERSAAAKDRLNRAGTWPGHTPLWATLIAAIVLICFRNSSPARRVR